MRVGALLGLVAACGRVGFDATTDGSTPDDAPIVLGSFTQIALPAGGSLADVARAADGTLYAIGVGGNIVRSGDDGATWQRCTGAPQELVRVTIASDGTLYVASSNGVASSSDGCASWQDLGLGRNTYVALGAGTRVIAGTDNGIYVKGPSGWGIEDLSGQLVVDMAMSAAGDRVYAATGGEGQTGVGVNCSIDGGLSFSACSVGLDSADIDFVAVDPSDGTHALAEIENPSTFELFETMDGGASWQQRFNASGGDAVAIDPADSTFVLWDTWNFGLEASTTGGMTFDGVDHRAAAMFGAESNRIVFGPSSHVYAATNRGLFTASDHTLAWAEGDRGLDAWEIGDIAVSPTGTIYLATQAGVLRSTDHGATWSEQTQGLGIITPTADVVQDPQASDTVLAAASVYLTQSTDAGQTYAQIWSPGLIDGYHVNRVHVTDSHGLIAATWDGVATSTDRQTFQRTSIDGGQYVTDVIALDANAQHMVATMLTDGVYVSSDGGTTWTSSSTGLGAKDAWCAAVLPDGSLLVGTGDGAFHAATSAGPWQASGLDGIEVDVLLVYGGRVIAATTSGVFASSDGATWQPVPGLDLEFPSALAIDSDGSLLVGTYGYGLYRTALP